VKREINFSNYDSFITNMKTYKVYLFDLALIRYDKNINLKLKTKADNCIKRQKFLFFLPYLLIGSTLFYHYRKKLFQVNMINKELGIITQLFFLLIFFRIFQKGLLKYEGDQILHEIAANKSHTIF